MVRDDPFQAQILLFQGLQALRLINAQSALLFLPPIISLLGEAELATGVDHRQAFAGVKLNRPQM